MLVRINVRADGDGYWFVLDEQVRQAMKARRAPVTVASRLFVGYGTKQDFEMIYGTEVLVNEIPLVLSGLSTQVLRDLGYEEVQYVGPNGLVQKTVRL